MQLNRGSFMYAQQHRQKHSEPSSCLVLHLVPPADHVQLQYAWVGQEDGDPVALKAIASVETIFLTLVGTAVAAPTISCQSLATKKAGRGVSQLLPSGARSSIFSKISEEINATSTSSVSVVGVGSVSGGVGQHGTMLKELLQACRRATAHSI